MAIEFENAILAGVTLVREAIQSQNFVQGADGWQIKADGSAEFSDLTIRSSDGSSSTVTVANGQITITDSGGNVVVELDADGYRLYDSDGDMVAAVKLDAGGATGGFWTRGFQTPRNIASQLTGGTLEFAPVTDGVVDVGGFLEYVVSDIASPEYALVRLSTGQIDSVLDDRAQLELESERGSTPAARIYGTNPGDPADLDVAGAISAGNLRFGTTQTPAPGGAPGQTSVTVAFAQPMTGTARVVCTPDTSSGNLDTTNIRWATTNEDANGFQLNCWRDTNFSTNFNWIAFSS